MAKKGPEFRNMLSSRKHKKETSNPRRTGREDHVLSALSHNGYTNAGPNGLTNGRTNGRVNGRV
ncbi:MAG: hypothetical protein KAS60_07345, partial [Thermoplasmata archaeon]|nr:hypothetical protein [Thermoplasmata archaeon]